MGFEGIIGFKEFAKLTFDIGVSILVRTISPLKEGDWLTKNISSNEIRSRVRAIELWYIRPMRRTKLGCILPSFIYYLHAIK